MSARALAHYTAMAREATQQPLRCVTCGGPAFECACTRADPFRALREASPLPPAVTRRVPRPRGVTR